MTGPLEIGEAQPLLVYILWEGKEAPGAVVRRFFFGFDWSATHFWKSATN